MRPKLFRISLIVLFCLSTQLSGIAHAQPIATFFDQTGFSVSDDGQGGFLSDFTRLGGLNTLGYPNSNPYQAGGFRYQGFQRAILQWHPELGRALLANTLDWLSDQGQDDWLDSIGIPRRQADSGGSWGQIVTEHEGWLTAPDIARAYRSGGGMDRFGLPQSRPERRGAFVVQRFQRVAFQLWLDQVPGMPAPGSVVGILAGDLAKQSGIIPAEATVATGPPTLASRGSDLGRYSGVSTEAEQVALSLVNQTRSDNGLPGVVMDDALQSSARAYAVEMATRNFFNHTDPDGRGLLDRLLASGVQNWSLGMENLGYGLGYKTPVDSVRANHASMMAETAPNDGHRRNILNPQARRVGIGVVQRPSDGKVYYVCDFTN